MIALEEPSWQRIAAEKRDEIYAAIPAAYVLDEKLLRDSNSVELPRRCGLLTARQLQITESRAVDIVARIQRREYTAVEVTTAFCKRAAIAHQATNCLAAVLFDNALEQARELDTYMEKHGKPIGPLHGLPVSVKEHIYLESTLATSGLVRWKDEMSPGDALIVKIFREAGAVFHVKTTNPMSLMALETDSNLFGRTTNPFNSNLTSGGSSGGESALIGMRGSALGIGTDIGGSIRVPSAFCGGYGLKGSVARFPHGGLSGLHGGMNSIVGCVGPMANCVEDLRLFSKVALTYQPWDYEPSLVEIPWKSVSMEDLPKKLNIGVMWNDGQVTPHPPVARALKESVNTLRAAGHNIIDWDPKLHPPLVKWINNAYFLDGAQEYHEFMQPSVDPPVPIMEWLLSTEAGKRCTLEETWKLNMEGDLLKTAYADQWRLAGIDVILCPANASVASAHDESRYWGYTAAFNALDLPGSVFPVSVVKSTDILTGDQPMLSERDREYCEFYRKGGPSKYRDAPISLQLVGRRFQEEKLLAMTDLIVETLAEAKAKSRIEVKEKSDNVTTIKPMGSHDTVPAQWSTGRDAHGKASRFAGEKLVSRGAMA